MPASCNTRCFLTGFSVSPSPDPGCETTTAWPVNFSSPGCTKRVYHWTDTSLDVEWDRMPEAVVALSDEINQLYWASIDRPKTVHWLAAWDLVASTLAPHPGSRWASRDLPLLGSPKELTDCVLDDEFPLSMFYEALQKKMSGTIERAVGLTGISVIG